MSFINLKKLTNVDEFTSHYYNLLKKQLNSQNIRLSKFGFIGYFLNLLGNMQYDIKMYYDNLFKESFPVTAENNDNLLYHSDIYNFDPYLASPSVLQGVVNISPDFFPSFSGLKKREIILENINLKIDDFDFTQESKFTLIQTNINNFTVEIFNPHTETKITYPISKSNPIFELVGFYQYDKEVFEFISPRYQFNTHYPYRILIENNDIYKIEVFVDTIQYEVLSNKNSSTEILEAVFYKRTSENDLIIELGSGIHGKYIGNKRIKIIVYKTKGNSGNLLLNYNDKYTISTNINIIDYGLDNSIRSYIINSSTFFYLRLYRSINGVDSLTGENLRMNLLKYIQSRNNLITEQDFYSMLTQLYQNSIILFKKLSLAVNDIFLYVLLTDRQNIPLYSTTSFLSVTQLESNIKAGKYIYYPEKVIFDKTFTSPFLYEYDKVFDIYKGYIVNEISNFYPNSIIQSNNIFFYDFPLIFLKFKFDDINIKNSIEISSPRKLDNYSFQIYSLNLSLTGQYLTLIDDNTYEYNYNNLIIGNIDIRIRTHIGDIFLGNFNLYTYTISDKTITFNALPFGIVIGAELKIQNKSFVYVTEIDITNKIITTNISLLSTDILESWENPYVDFYFNNVITVHDISHILSLKKFRSSNSLTISDLEDNPLIPVNEYWIFRGAELNYLQNSINNNSTTIYGINIPFIDKESFNSDKEFYINKLISDLYFINSYTTMLTDDIQIRFMNTYTVERKYLSKLTTENIFYDFNLELPIKLIFDLILNKQYIIINKLDVLIEIEKIRTDIANKLKNIESGPVLNFYISEFIDLVHNYQFIKSCKLKAYDNNDIEITDIITKNQTDIIKSINDGTQEKKLDILIYTPIYFWFDVNNIIINYNFEK